MNVKETGVIVIGTEKENETRTGKRKETEVKDQKEVIETGKRGTDQKVGSAEKDLDQGVEKEEIAKEVVLLKKVAVAQEEENHLCTGMFHLQDLSTSLPYR